MTERFDALHGRKDEKSGKTYWTRIGAAFPSDRGGYNVVLDCLPGPDPKSGQFRILLTAPKPREDRGGPAPATGGFDDDQSIPF